MYICNGMHLNICNVPLDNFLICHSLFIAFHKLAVSKKEKKTQT